MNFKDQLFRSSPLFSENNILKFGEKITLENRLFVNKLMNKQIYWPPIFYDWITFSTNPYKFGSSWSVNDHFNIPTYCTQKYAHFSIRASAIYSLSSTRNLLIKNLSLRTST